MICNLILCVYKGLVNITWYAYMSAPAYIYIAKVKEKVRKTGPRVKFLIDS